MQYCATFFEHLDLEVNSTNYKVRLIHINTEILSAPLHNLDSNVSFTAACVAVFGSVSNTHNSFNTHNARHISRPAILFLCVNNRS